MSKDWINKLKKLKNIEDWLVILSPKNANYSDSILKIIKYLNEDLKGDGGIVIFNRPYEDYIKLLKSNKIKTEKLKFIDCVTKLSKKEPGKEDNVLFIRNPMNLSDIAIGITQVISSMKSKEKFLVIDSLSTLLIYHDSSTITQFMHFVSSKLRNENVKGVIVLLERDMKEQIGSVVSQFAELVLEV